MKSMNLFQLCFIPLLRLSCRKSMDWPARSSDLNPIEHACDILQHAVTAQPVQPRTLQELKDALVTEWRLIPQNRIRTLITIMRRRCRAVINAR